MPSSTSSSEPAAARPWPAAFLAAVALFAACEALAWSRPRLLEFAWRHTPAGPRGDALLITAATRLLAPDGGPPTVVLLGSSQVREGLDCDAFAARLARPCHNLAISAGSPLDLLYISSHLRDDVHRVTVVGVFPKVLHGRIKSAFVDRSALACLLSSGAWRDLDAGDWRDVGYGLVMQLSPTLRNKDGLWELYDFAHDRRAAFWHGRLPDAPRRLLAKEEAQPDAYFAERVNVLNPDVGAPETTPAQDEALRRLVSRERRLGNPVVLVDFPTRPGYETTISAEWRAHRDRLMAEMAARGDVRVVRPQELPALGTADFLDFTHLAPSGRQKVSAALAEIVADAAAP